MNTIYCILEFALKKQETLHNYNKRQEKVFPYVFIYFISMLILELLQSLLSFTRIFRDNILDISGFIINKYKYIL